MRNEPAEHEEQHRPNLPVAVRATEGGKSPNELPPNVIGVIGPKDIIDFLKELFGGPRPTDEEVKMGRIRQLADEIEKLLRRNDEIKGEIDKLNREPKSTERDDKIKELEREKDTNDKLIDNKEKEKTQAQGSTYPSPPPPK